MNSHLIFVFFMYYLKFKQHLNYCTLVGVLKQNAHAPFGLTLHRLAVESESVLDQDVICEAGNYLLSIITFCHLTHYLLHIY